MILPHDRILVTVSGGADSVCLMLVLRELGYEIAVAHVNHGLRGPASDDDERFTAKLARDLGLTFFAQKVVLPGGNVEAAGRIARKEFFNELAHTHGFSKIAVAHTRNDRIETFLLHLLRGAGPAGLSSMAAVSGNTIRPLIGTSRDEVEAYLKEKNQSWRTDTTNFDLAFARNRLRHNVIPKLSADFNPNLMATISRTVEILEDEDAWMQILVEEWLNRNGTKEPDQFVIEVTLLHAAPVGFVRRVLRSALRRAGSTLTDVSFDQIEDLRALLKDGKSGKVVELPGGIEVARDFKQIVIRYKRAKPADYEYKLKIPGSVHIPELGKVFSAEFVAAEACETTGPKAFVDADSLGPYVRIRNWKPGDYYRPVGLPAGKLKKLFQRARIPRSHRTSWPVVVADSSIIWVASFPVSREFAPRGRSQKIVAIEAVQI